ncbi:TetR/AcrR family transcriptional regulator [Nitratireductor sp. GCM10026969]|uniref:TetR/AcrR family transcriptional regulator n=1 Tax=Nitratireductor sp. GCM10026969 TaxID=3252645 RepID=UPI00360D7977
MSKWGTSVPRRRKRADGERNRAQLIIAAKNAIAEHGAAVSLDQVSRDAGVSIATLYRHFPSRDALLQEVYSEEVEALIGTAEQLTADHDPVTALREWLVVFVEFLNTKRGMADALSTLIDGPDALFSETHARLSSPISALVARATDTGKFRIDVEPLDLLRALTGVANVRPDPDWKQSAIHLIDHLIRGAELER